MKIGLLVPQGWKGEYKGWDAALAWERTIELAVQAENLGFESLWVFDHFTTVPPADEITFESFSTLAALAALTRRVRLGHLVICASYRNPALTAKVGSTLDIISNGRFELGIGAGWKEDEWLAYGYTFPPIGERLDVLGEHLAIITRMLGPGRATFEGRYSRVREAINIPKGIQPHIPIIVGGNGRQRTAGYAIRFADELNLDFLSPAEVAGRMAEVRSRCEQEGRDPATLRFSAYAVDEDMRHAGQARVDLLGAYDAIGLDRLVCFPTRWEPTPDAQARLASDCRLAGLTLDGA
ncbi:MAG: TIGR03560 family F420-dependent LLM class oxidoreductase [Candidatus Limnocylindrales bacterium]